MAAEKKIRNEEGTHVIIPHIIEQTPRGDRAWDIFSLLLKERIVFLGTPINDFVANIILAQLLYLEREDADKDITMYIQSPGGIISAGLAIYDTMQLIRCDVATIAVGEVASMGTVLLSAGAKGKRYALPNATIHIHQARGGATGQAADIERIAKEVLRRNELVLRILAKHTGQPLEQIVKDTDRDHFFDAEQARAYGLIDEIVGKAN